MLSLAKLKEIMQILKIWNPLPMLIPNKLAGKKQKCSKICITINPDIPRIA